MEYMKAIKLSAVYTSGSWRFLLLPWALALLLLTVALGADSARAHDVALSVAPRL